MNLGGLWCCCEMRQRTSELRQKWRCWLGREQGRASGVHSDAGCSVHLLRPSALG